MRKTWIIAAALVCGAVALGQTIIETGTIRRPGGTITIPDTTGTMALTSDIVAEADTLATVVTRGATTLDAIFTGGLGIGTATLGTGIPFNTQIHAKTATGYTTIFVEAEQYAAIFQAVGAQEADFILRHSAAGANVKTYYYRNASGVVSQITLADDYSVSHYLAGLDLATGRLAITDDETWGSFPAKLYVNTNSTSRVGVIVRGVNGQSSNLIEAQTNTPSTVFAVSPSGAVTASGYTAGASAGMTTVVTVRDSGGAADCTMTFTGGILTATTCSHT